MNFPSAVILTSLAAICRLTAAAQDAPPPPVEQSPARDIATLIGELSNDSFRVREKATAEIWKMGETALPELKEAAASSDPEQSFRARDLLRKIQLHITPDTDPSVILLVERYLKASPSEKTALLGRMKGKRAWRQMLKLYASETDAAVREKLSEAVNGIAIIAARERLGKGDPEGAREFLEMAPADADGLLALAEFHRSHGTLEAELERAKTIDGRKSAFWQLALYRAAGNLEAARDAADRAGDPQLAACMAALAGDPLPWLRGYATRPGEDPVSEAYSAVAIRRWLGQQIRPSDLEPLVQPLSLRRTSERRSAMNALFLLGEVESVEAAFVKSEPLAAFRYYQSLERMPDALKAVGLDPEQPDYKPWIEKRLGKLSADEIEDQHGVNTYSEELVALANLLERKGLHDEAFKAFSGPLNALAEKDTNTFIDFLALLFGKTGSSLAAPHLAKRIGVVWAGDDEKRWEEIVIAGLGDDDQSTAWWDWFAELAPAETRAERFDGLMAVFCLGPDPSDLRKKWLARAWKAQDAAAAGERAILAERIFLATMDTDVANCLKAWELMPEKSRGDLSWEQQIALLSSVDRWDDAAGVILKHLDVVTNANQSPGLELYAYAAAVLRRAGRVDEAAVHDRKVDQLVLGNPILALEVGRIYAFGGDYQRASEWWARAARESSPDSREFAFAMKLHADALLEQGRWLESAAVSEVTALQYAGSGLNWMEPLPFMHVRLQADMSRALAILKDRRAESIAILERCHRTFASDGSLADFFFPSIRKAGLVAEHDQWFNESWKLMAEYIERFPESDNTRNTLAWFASRAVRNLDEAETHLKKALSANPIQSAYLDTMAEIQFARGNREKALEWSELALNYAPGDSQLRQQQERFRSGPLPK